MVILYRDIFNRCPLIWCCISKTTNIFWDILGSTYGLQLFEKPVHGTLVYLFICKVITAKKFFCFYKQCSQAATRLICELGTFAQNASIISVALIYLCILKRIPWKNYVRLWKWNIKSTSQSAKIRFPENQIETFALIQHDFIR